MHAVMFIGIPASGKSTYFAHRFAETHVRINLDMLVTRHREERLIAACLEISQPFVIDNTNVTRSDRARYLPRLAEARVPVHGYYFQSEIASCKARNDAKSSDRQVPLKGLLGMHGKLELPELAEGFATLSYVKINPREDTDQAMGAVQQFSVEEWRP